MGIELDSVREINADRRPFTLYQSASQPDKQAFNVSKLDIARVGVSKMASSVRRSLLFIRYHCGIRLISF